MTIFVPAVRHFCSPPMVPYTMTPPKFLESDPEPEPQTYMDLPPEGSVWRCASCGRTWKVYPPQYANTFTRRWEKCSAWAYRRAVRKAVSEL